MNWNTELLEELQANLQVLDDCKLECDGMTYAISGALKRARLTHTRMVGHVYWKPGEDVVHPHCWIDLPCGAVIDFRLRMWLGDDDEIPHGVFIPKKQQIEYVGQPHLSRVPTSNVLDLMTDGKWSKVRLEHLEQTNHGSTSS